MSKVALYFRKWKNYSRHKNVGDDFEYATKLADLSEENGDDAENNDMNADLDIFQVKFLGSTTIDSPKSEEATANAIKSIIAAAKSSNKKLQRINLSVCPKGIETFDVVTGCVMHQVSIYKISYCSADANHSNVFAFIGGTGFGRPESCHDENDTLTCYAFLCAKRKIAHNLTLTVAKNFQRAYDLWQKAEQRKTLRCEMERLNGANLLTESKLSNKSMRIIENDNNRMSNGSDETYSKNLLIDFGADITSSERQRKLLQTAWVSFDEDVRMYDSGMQSTKIFENNLWEKNLIYS